MRKSWPVWALLAATLLLFTVALGARDLWNPNEPLYGQAIVEMEQSGSWLIPTVEGRPFPEKPPLYYILARGSAALFGVNEFSLRFPSALAGWILVWVTFLLGRQVGGVQRGMWSAAVLVTTYAVWWNARSLQMDLLLSACSAGAIAAGLWRLEWDAPPNRAWPLCGMALGCGLLAKGPVAAVIVLMPLGLHALLSGRRRRLLEPAFLWVPALSAAIVAPVLLGWLRSPEGAELLREMLFRQNVSRFLDAWDHRNPWWYFGLHFWMDMAPWAFLLPLAIGLRPQNPAERNLHRFSWIWILSVVLFFSLSSSKRSVYILPVAPAMALLVSGWIVRWESTAEQRRRAGWKLKGWRVRAALLAQAAIGGTILFAGIWAFRNLESFPLLKPGIAPFPAVLTVAGGCVCLGVVVYRLRPLATPMALAVGVYAVFFAAGLWGLPAIDPYKSARGFGDQLRSTVADDEPIAAFDLWEWRANYTFYSGRFFDRLVSEEELRRWWEGPAEGWLLIEWGSVDRAAKAVDLPKPTIDARIGSNRVHLYRKPTAASNQLSDTR